MNTATAHPKPALDDKAIARLKQINVQLDALQTQIHEVAKTYHRHISQAAKEAGLPLNNIHMQAELDFCLKPLNPNDDCDSADDDDGLVSRTLSQPQLPDLLNFGINEPGSVIGPQGWLFHDLTEHAYGVEQPQVPLAALLELDRIYVEIVIRQPVQFDL